MYVTLVNVTAKNCPCQHRQSKRLLPDLQHTQTHTRDHLNTALLILATVTMLNTGTPLALSLFSRDELVYAISYLSIV